MLHLLFWVAIILIVVFGFVVFIGAPYVPTLKRQTNEALELLGLVPGQILVELGSGDGTVLLAAAKQGVRSIGYEINPLLVVLTYARTFRYRHLVTVKCANFWRVTLPECDAIYVFLLDKYMEKLDKKITKERKSALTVVSFAFKIPSKPAVVESQGLYKYIYN